jgi:hypothetical protein
VDVIEHEGGRFESGGSTVVSLDSYLNNQLTDVLVRRDVLEGDPAENIIAHDHSEKVNMVVMAAKDTVRCAAFSCGPSLRTFWAKKNRCGPQYTPMAARRLCFEIFSVLSICPPGCDDSWHRLMRLPLPLKSGCSRCTRCAVSRPQMLPLRHCGPDYPTPRISVPDSYRVPSGTDRHAAQAVVIFYYPWEVLVRGGG